MEINNWELKNRSMEEEVVALKAEKEELHYILAAHMSTCALQLKVELANSLKLNKTLQGGGRRGGE